MIMKRPRIQSTKVKIPKYKEEGNDFKILDLRKEVANEQLSDSNQEKPMRTEPDNILKWMPGYYKVVADEQYSDPSLEIPLSEALKSNSNVEVGDWLYKVNGQINPYVIIKAQRQWPKLNGFLSKNEICRNKGWTDFTFRFLGLSPHKLVDKMPYYKEEIINEIEKSSRFKRYLETVQTVDEMLKWFDKTDMTKWEFLDAVVFIIPEIPKEALIKNACYSYNDNIDNNPSYEVFEFDGKWYGPRYADPGNDDEKRLAAICLNYLRHRYTPYVQLLYKFCSNMEDPERDKFHDELKNKVNTAIYNAYPWILKNI